MKDNVLSIPIDWAKGFGARMVDAPLFELRRLTLFLGIMALPFGHLLGTLFFLITALLGVREIGWRVRGLAVSLCLPFAAAYGLILGAELLSPNPVGDTLETAFNYLPLLLLPVVFAVAWRSGVDSMKICVVVLVTSVLMATMALAEVFVFGQSAADGNVIDAISIAPAEFALVAFLYGLIGMKTLLLNKEPMVNAVPWPFVVLGLFSCLLCIFLTKTSVMVVPMVVVVLVGVFALAFGSRRVWIAPSILVIVVFLGVAVSSLEIVQLKYESAFQTLAQTLAIEPREGPMAQSLSMWLAGWQMAQEQVVYGHGNIHATLVALQEYRQPDWPVFVTGSNFKSAFVDHIVLFGAMGLAGLLMIVMAPLVVVGPPWFRQYTAIIVVGTFVYALFGRFMNNDITGAVMLVVWLSLLLTQSLVGQKRR